MVIGFKPGETIHAGKNVENVKMEFWRTGKI